MRQIHGFYLFLFLFASLAQLSCQKQERIFPEVQIFLPEKNQTFSFGDTLRVGVKITKTDGNITRSLLQGSQSVSVESIKFFSIRDTVYYDFYFTDRYLPSGNYDIRITAFNGSEGTSAFLPINYSELPKRLIGIAALGGDNLIKLDSANNQSSFNLGNTYKSLVFNGRHQSLAIMSAHDDILGINFRGLSSEYTFSEPPISSTFDKYKGIIAYENNNFVLKSNGTVLRLDKEGNITRIFSLPTNQVPLMADIVDGKMLIGAQQFDNNLYSIHTLNLSTGNVIKTLALPGRVLAVSAIEAGEFVVAYKSGADSEITHYHLDNNFLTNNSTVEGEEVTSLLTLNSNSALASTSQKIYTINPSSFSLPQEVFNFGTNKLLVDDVSGLVYLSSGNDVIQVNGTQLSIALSHSQPINDFTLVHNK